VVRLAAHPLWPGFGPGVGEVVVAVLTIAKLRQWSVRYYNDTSRAALNAAMDRRSANGGLGEYYTEGETRGAVWLVVGDAERVAGLVGLSAQQRAGGAADLDVVARWLDDGIAPNGASGRRFAERHNHGFDLTFCAPKSVSVLRALDTGGVVSKAVVEAHTAGITAALEYLHRHAGYTRVHNPVTGMKDLQRLPGLVAAAYQHETSRAGDPHLHTHVLVPNRQARADGVLVAIDSDSLWHEARAAGVIYQATLRRRVWELAGLEWEPADTHSGMAEVAGVDGAVLAAASQRSTQLQQWATQHLAVGESVTAAQLASAQKATRPKKPEHRPWGELREEWAGRFGELTVDPAAQATAREARVAAGRVRATEVVAAAVAGIERSAFTRADLVEALGARLPVTVEATPADPLELVEALADRAAVRITEARAPHEREGHDRYTAAPMIAEEIAVWEMIGARNPAAVIDTAADAAGLSGDQARAVGAVAASPWLVQVLTAPAGAGKTTSLRALRDAAHRGGITRVVVVAPTGRAVDVALAEGAADTGATVAAALTDIREGRWQLDAATLLLVDEAAMVGTPALRALLAAATGAGVKTVLVGDAHQLAPVRSRGGMFAELVADLPWAQHLSAVWRMADPGERDASLAIRDGAGAPLAAAVDWYRDAGRLHTGDPVTMAADAYTAWAADRAGGVDSLLIADRWEIADALNERIHRDTVPADAPTVGGARRCRIGVGDVVISRRNDPTLAVYAADSGRGEVVPLDDAPVRNGQRWQVENIDPEGERIGVRRIGDGALTVFEGDYLHRHVHHGYAVTVHAAQGATTDRCHAVLSVGGRRSGAYVAMTRGRHANHVYLYEQIAGEQDHEHTPTPADGVHPARRGDPGDAETTLLELLGRDEPSRTAAATAAGTDRAGLPAAVVELLDVRARALAGVRAAHHDHTQAAARAAAAAALVERTADLQAAVEGFVCADAGRSGAAIYPAPPAGTHGLDEPARQIVAAIATSIRSVQPVSCADPGQRGAIIAAAADAARQGGRTAWLTHPASVGESEIADLPAGVRVVDAGEAVAAMGDPQHRLPPGGLLIVEGPEQLPAEQLTALCLHAGTTNTKVLLVSDPTTSGPGRDLTDTLTGLPWAHHHGTARTTRGTIVERAAAWTAAHPPAAVEVAEPGRDLPAWLRHTLTDAANHRSAAVIGRPPARATLAGLEPAARRAVQRIILSPTTVHTLDLHTSGDDGSRGKAAVLTALARTGSRGVQMAVIPIGPGAVEQAAGQPYQRYLLDPKTAADALGRRTWQPPPGSRIVLDGADHLPTDTLVWWLRTATRHDLTLVLVTDQTHPGPQRDLTDTLAATAPWAAHHLHHTADTQQQAATTTVGQLVGAYTSLIDTHRAAERAMAEQLQRYRQQQRTRDRSRHRDDGYDLSL
jgi:conjugative relaxase-like TrwC/TraI family protein